MDMREKRENGNVCGPETTSYGYEREKRMEMFVVQKLLPMLDQSECPTLPQI
jgi:hypothetical protein